MLLPNDEAKVVREMNVELKNACVKDLVVLRLNTCNLYSSLRDYRETKKNFDIVAKLDFGKDTRSKDLADGDFIAFKGRLSQRGEKIITKVFSQGVK